MRDDFGHAYEMYRSDEEGIDATARPGATGPIEEADYRPLDYQDPAAGFSRPGVSFTPMMDQRNTALIAEGAQPLLTFAVWKLPSGECRVVTTVHVDKPDREAEPERFANVYQAVDFAHSLILDVARRSIDGANGDGEAARRLFSMAVDEEFNAGMEDRSDEPSGSGTGWDQANLAPEGIDPGRAEEIDRELADAHPDPDR